MAAKRIPKLKAKEQADPASTGDSFVQLYLAQKRGTASRTTSMPRGRPIRTFPWVRFQGEISKLDKAFIVQWQSRFTKMLGRKPGLAEVAGMLARICNARLEKLGFDDDVPLTEFIDKMIG